MAPKETDLNRLSSLSSQLNEAADDFVTEVEQLEKRLSEIRFAVEVWLSPIRWRQDSRMIEHKVSSRPRKQDWVTYSDEYHELGYCKVGSNWRIAVRRVTGGWDETSIGDDANDPQNGWQSYDDPVPLAMASRVVRGAAAPLLDDLVKALVARAEGLLDNLKSAEQLAKVTADDA